MKYFNVGFKNTFLRIFIVIMHNCIYMSVVSILHYHFQDDQAKCFTRGIEYDSWRSFPRATDSPPFVEASVVCFVTNLGPQETAGTALETWAIGKRQFAKRAAAPYSWVKLFPEKYWGGGITRLRSISNRSSSSSSNSMNWGRLVVCRTTDMIA